jgi:hypothetical protein
MQRVSVSCTLQKLSNVRDEAVEKRVVSSVFHASRRVRVSSRLSSVLVGDAREPARRATLSGVQSRRAGVNARHELLAGCSEQGRGDRSEVTCLLRRYHGQGRGKRGRADALLEWGECQVEGVEEVEEQTARGCSLGH